eukprot:gb/GECG01009563.1/.p1 GENE.gb/GECG01009563.1/~~gb/GECG01009563.1/.p1  ORF type:complete len:1379 (+),score=219.48 gb/GECG01009563.1/:1-4137(+)
MSGTTQSSGATSSGVSSGPPPPPGPKPKPPSKKPPPPPAPASSTHNPGDQPESKHSLKGSAAAKGDASSPSTPTKRPPKPRSAKPPKPAESKSESMEGSPKPPPPKKPPPSKEASPPGNKPKKGKKKPPPPAKKPPPRKTITESDEDGPVAAGTDAKSVNQSKTHTNSSTVLGTSSIAVMRDNDSNNNMASTSTSKQHRSGKSDNADVTKDTAGIKGQNTTRDSAQVVTSTVGEKRETSKRDATSYESKEQVSKAYLSKNTGEQVHSHRERQDQTAENQVLPTVPIISLNEESASTVTSARSEPKFGNGRKVGDPTESMSNTESVASPATVVSDTSTPARERDRSDRTPHSTMASIVGSADVDASNESTVTFTSASSSEHSGNGRMTGNEVEANNRAEATSGAQNTIEMARRPIPAMSLSSRSESIDNTSDTPKTSITTNELSTDIDTDDSPTGLKPQHSEPATNGAAQQHLHHRSIRGRRSVSSGDLDTASAGESIVATRSASSREVSQREEEASEESKKGIFKRFGLGRKSLRVEEKPTKSRKQGSIFQRLRMRASGKKSGRGSDKEEPPSNTSLSAEKAMAVEEPPPLPELPSLDELGEPPEHLLKALNAKEGQEQYSLTASSAEYEQAPSNTEYGSISSCAMPASSLPVTEARSIYSNPEGSTDVASNSKHSHTRLDAVAEGSESEDEDQESRAVTISENNEHASRKVEGVATRITSTPSATSPAESPSLPGTHYSVTTSSDRPPENAGNTGVTHGLPPNSTAEPVNSLPKAKALVSGRLTADESLSGKEQQGDVDQLNKLAKKLRSVKHSMEDDRRAEWPRIPESTVIALMNPDQRLRQFEALQRVNSELEKSLIQFQDEVAKVFIDMWSSVPSVSYRLGLHTLKKYPTEEWFPSLLQQLCFCYLLKLCTTRSDLALYKQQSESIGKIIIGGIEEVDFEKLRLGTLCLRRSPKVRPNRVNLGIREVDSRKLQKLMGKWRHMASLRAFIGPTSMYADSVSPSTQFGEADLRTLHQWVELEQTVVNTLREQVRDASIRLEEAIGESSRRSMAAELEIGSGRMQSIIAGLWEEIESMEQGLNQYYDDEEWASSRSTCEAWSKSQNRLSESALSGVLDRLESARLHRAAVEQRLKEAHVTANRTEEMKCKLEKDLKIVRDTMNSQHPRLPVGISLDEGEQLVGRFNRKDWTDRPGRLHESIAEEYRAFYGAKLENVRNETRRKLCTLRNNAETTYENALRDYGERFRRTMRSRVGKVYESARHSAVRRKDLQRAVKATDEQIEYAYELQRRIVRSTKKRRQNPVASQMVGEHLYCVYQRKFLQRLLVLFDEYEQISGSHNGWKRKFLWDAFFRHISYSPKLHKTISQRMRRRGTSTA